MMEEQKSPSTTPQKESSSISSPYNCFQTPLHHSPENLLHQVIQPVTHFYPQTFQVTAPTF